MTGEKDRDEHLRSADFFEVESYPKIAFEGRFVDRTGDSSFKATADLIIRATSTRLRSTWSTSGSGRHRSGTARRIAAR